MVFDFIRAHQLNMMLVLSGICIMLVFLLVLTRFLSRPRKISLILMELIAFSLVWFDRQAYIWSGDVTRKGYIMVRVSNFIVFFMTSAIVQGFNIYLSDWLLHEGGMKKLPLRLKISGFSANIGMLMSVISAFTGLYYYFDEMNRYQRGPGFLIAYIIPVAVPIIQYTVIFQNRKLFSPLIYTSLVLYIFVPMVCAIIQVFAYGISITNMAMVLVSIFLYVFAYLDINDTVQHAHEIEIRDMQGEKARMKKLFDQTAGAFVSAVEKKDEYNIGTSARVAYYARKIAELAGKNEEECEMVYYSALLHDVGLIGIPDDVIKAESTLEEWKYEVMKQKPLISRDILSSITEYPYLSVGANYSHERYNGSGYPEGLKGEEIPEIARIIAVADAYVAMTTKKRYREARPSFVAREAFVKDSGVLFDPRFSEIMIEIIDSEISAGKDIDEVESALSCRKYRDRVSYGICVSENVTRVTFSCTPAEGWDHEFSEPSIILFDSYDRRVHNDERSIIAYQYLEYGEFWFDSHSISNAARRIQESFTEKEPEDGLKDLTAEFEIIMGRFADHLRLTMISPFAEKEIIVALPNSTNASYISLTGENCEITDIKVEETGEKIAEGDIPRIADVISYTDRMESDVKNIQIDRTRSAHTHGVELKDRLRLMFHTMSLPGANLVWHCPYIIIFSSGDGTVYGPDYREYAAVKLNGETDPAEEYATNSIYMKRRDEFPGWDVWKEKNKEGLECDVRLVRKGDRIELRTVNLGVEVENTTTIKDKPSKVYVALSGDVCALTDIRVR